MSILNLFIPNWKYFGVNLREAITRKIKNERVLAIIAKIDWAIEVQIKAVEGISNDEILIDLAKNSIFNDVRGMALDKLTIPTIFTEFYKNNDSGIKLIVLKLNELIEEVNVLESFHEQSVGFNHLHYQSIRMIGEGLFNCGGISLMERIAFEVGLKGKAHHNQLLQFWWHGIR